VKKLRLCSYDLNGIRGVGVLIGNGKIADITKCYAAKLKAESIPNADRLAHLIAPPDMIKLIENGDVGLSAIKQAVAFADGSGRELCKKSIFEPAQIHFNAPIPKPNALCAVVQNTIPAIMDPETRTPDILTPLYGYTPNTAITGPYDAIEIPADSGIVGSESELAIIISKKAKYVEPEDAMDYVYGYTIHNDVSGLEIQDKFEWIHNAGDIRRVYAGQCKTMDTWSPMGPWLYTKDEVPDPNRLHISAWVDDVLIQDGNTSEMYHKIPDIISFLSYGHTFYAGDIISWGNIYSRVDGMTGYKADLLGRGGTLITKIEGLGEIRNPIKRIDKVYRHPAKNFRKAAFI